MPNLDAKALRFMSTDEFRVLTATEMGMKNHELVPTPLIESIAGLKRGGTFKVIKLLAKNKLIKHESKPYDGYRLTAKGYDYLALKSLAKRGTLQSLGIQIGVGKESDIFTVVTEEGEEVCLKLHRLGRTCFRQIKNKRDYIRSDQHASWLYLSRLSALKEYAFMKALHNHGFPVPRPIDVNRHCVIMSLGSGYQLNSIQQLRHPALVFDALMEQICRLASFGLIHCDFNEFNLLVNDEEQVTIIDFPQMVSTEHINAEYYFNRDVECIRTFFKRRFGFEAAKVPKLFVDTERCDVELDEELRASGWDKAASEDFTKLVALTEEVGGGEAKGDDEEEEDESDASDGPEEEEEEEEEEEGEQEGEEEEGGGEEEREQEGGLQTEAADVEAIGLPPESVEVQSTGEGASGGGEEAHPATEAEAPPPLAAADIERGVGGLRCEDTAGGAAAEETASVAGSAARSRLSRMSSASRRPPVTQADIAERVKRDLQKQHHRATPKTSRNESKDRSRRKTAGQVKQELSGASGWGMDG